MWGPAVFPIEFKCGEQRFTTDAYNQTWDYGLDLKVLGDIVMSRGVIPTLRQPPR